MAPTILLTLLLSRDDNSPPTPSGWNGMSTTAHFLIPFLIFLFFLTLFLTLSILSRRRRARRRQNLQNLSSQSQRPLYTSLDSNSTLPYRSPRTPLYPNNSNDTAAHGREGLPVYSNAGGLGMGLRGGYGSEAGTEVLDVPPPVYEPRGHSMDEENAGLVADGKMPLSERIS